MTGMLARYEALISAGELRPDREQRSAREQGAEERERHWAFSDGGVVL